MSSSRPTVCIVAPEFIGPYPNGGVGTACYWEAMSLGRAGYDLTVLYTGATERYSPEHWEAHFTTAPFQYVDLGRWASVTGADHELGHFEPAAPEAGASELVLKYLRAHRFDLVLAQEFQGHGLRSLQARQSGDALQGARVAVTLHGSRHWTCEGMRRLPIAPDMLVDFLEKESVRLADRVIAPSRSMAEWVVSRWGVTPPTVIPYCYDDRIATARSVVDHAGPFRHLVFFGRLETRKGVQLLVRALADSAILQDCVERVTFLGKHARIEGIPSDQFLESELAKVPNISFEIISDKGSHEAIDWLKSQRDILAVSPSLGDNMPYALIELYTHRIPFVTTRVGGIPDIVGDRNAHVLAEPTVGGLRKTLEQICSAGRLTMDYRDGYDAAAATRTHVGFIADLLAQPSPVVPAPRMAPLHVVVTDVATTDDVARTRDACCAKEAVLAQADWLTLDEWRARPHEVDTLFLHSSVRPETGMVARLRQALADSANDAVTSFFLEHSDADEMERLIAPLGGAIDTGWVRNHFGGPCLLAGPVALTFIHESTQAGFEFWPVYAAMTCGGLTLAVVPATLYASDTRAREVTFEQTEAVIREYHTRRPDSLDLRWILKGAYLAANGAPIVSHEPRRSTPSVGAPRRPPVSHTGRALYDRLIAIPDGELCGFAELDAPAVQADPFFRDLSALRRRIASLVARWDTEAPRVYVYGAGQHTRMLLAAFPALGRFVSGFIDRRPSGTFLGKPCVRPHEFANHMADAIVYSSREFERDMYTRMASARVEHVLLYNDPPADPPQTDTVARLQNRFGHQSSGREGLIELHSRRPAWMRGAISGGDTLFLFEMVHAMRPRHVLELGVASGGSSGGLLYAIDQLPPVEGGRSLSSFDVLPRCYFDDRYATGEVALVMHPNPHARWTLETAGMDARAVARAYAPGTFDFAFVDANHCHPWPLLDVLHLTSVLKPGSWIVLHDIELPNLFPQTPDRGALLLFERWPFNKVHGVVESRNVGAIQLEDDPEALVSMALPLLELSWQWPVHEALAELPRPFAQVEASIRARITPAPAVLVAG